MRVKLSTFLILQIFLQIEFVKIQNIGNWTFLVWLDTRKGLSAVESTTFTQSRPTMNIFLFTPEKGNVSSLRNCTYKKLKTDSAPKNGHVYILTACLVDKILRMRKSRLTAHQKNCQVYVWTPCLVDKILRIITQYWQRSKKWSSLYLNRLFGG